MNIPGKLQVIKKLSGLSQEKLAREFSVSFATFNSWINGRSTPREKVLKKIEELYLEYTGQKIIPADELAIKKQDVKNKVRFYTDVLKHILDNPDIHDEFVLALTYNSNSIEGSTLTEAETDAILFRDAVIPDKTLIEHLEAKNHQTALSHLFQYMKESTPALIDEELVLTLHGILMNSIRPDAGNYRSHGVRIVGSGVPTANYVKIPILMSRLFDDIKKTKEDEISSIAAIHSRFEQIHPFSDGNGRVGRLLIHAMALRENLSPAVIKQEKKQLYYTYLNKAQQTGDTSLLEDFICDAMLEGFRILDRK